MAQVNPYLTFNGNCEAAFLFYKSVFGDIRMFYENDVRFLEQFKASI